MLESLSLGLMTALALPLVAAPRADIGLSTHGTVIERMLVPGAPKSKLTVVVIGGMQGADDSTRRVERAVRDFEKRTMARRAGARQPSGPHRRWL
jgi:hypothetical protein